MTSSTPMRRRAPARRSARRSARPLATSLPATSPLTAPVRRRTLGRGLGAAATLAGAGVFAAGCAGESAGQVPADGEVDQVTYLTSFGMSAREAYVLVAKEKGYFTEQGIEVSIEPGTGGDGNHQALAGGAAQFAAVDSTGALVRYGNDPAGEEADRYRLVAMVHQQPLMAWLSVADRGIEHPADLAGRRIGLATGSVAELMWPVYADLAGVDQSEVETVPTSPQSQVQQLAAGQVDVIAQFVASRPSLELATEAEIHALPWAEHLPDLYGNAIVTTAELVQRRPELVDRFVAALMAGLARAISHPAEAAELLHEAEPALDPEIAAEELALMAPYVQPAEGVEIGACSPERLARAVSLLQGVNAVPADSRVGLDRQVVAWEHVPGAAAAG